MLPLQYDILAKSLATEKNDLVTQTFTESQSSDQVCQKCGARSGDQFIVSEFSDGSSVTMSVVQYCPVLKRSLCSKCACGFLRLEIFNQEFYLSNDGFQKL